MRTLVIICLLAQTLSLYFAKSYKAPFHKVFSSIRITDDLMENIPERITARKSGLNCLNQNDNLVLVSMHDIELVDLLKHSGYTLYHFRESVEDKTRNAARIIEINGFPKEITQEATVIERTSTKLGQQEYE